MSVRHRDRKKKSKNKKGGERRGGTGTRAARTRREPAPAAEARTRTGRSSDPPTPSTGRLIPRWWERGDGPQLLERELTELEVHGYAPRPDPAAGRMRVEVRFELQGALRDAMVVYSMQHPYFHPTVRLLEPLGLVHHESPSGELCLLADPSRQWTPSMTVARLLDEQLPMLAEALRDPETESESEAHSAEPVSQLYWHYRPGAIMAMPLEAYEIPGERPNGRLGIRMSRNKDVVRGFVTAIDDRVGTLPDLGPAFDAGATEKCRWVRIPRPKAVEVGAIERELIESGAVEELSPGRRNEIIGLLFDDEVEYPSKLGPSWAFLYRERIGRRSWKSSLIRAEPFVRERQTERIAQLAGLAGRRVLQVGGGGLGAPVFTLLAQSMLGFIRIVDADLVELVNAVRWVLGISAAGLPKAFTLRQFALANWPLTDVDEIQWRIGASAQDAIVAPALHDEDYLVERAFDRVDAVVDASADLRTQHFLADECRRRGLPYIGLWATPGGYGGVVARLRANGACWACLQRTIGDGVIDPPLDERAGVLHGEGCGGGTFRASAFDLAPLAAQAARLVAQTLAPSDEFPDTTDDVSIYYARADDAGTTVGTPRWEHRRLEIHPDCRAH